MLLDFSLKNYRSYKEEVKIDFTPEIRKKSKDDYRDSIKVVKCGKKNKEIINSSFIYGYNGTGKSNLIRGLFNLKELLKKSRNDDEPDFLKDFYDPFLFDEKSQKKDTYIKISWLMEKSKGQNMEYHYTISYNKNLISTEELNGINMNDRDPNPHRKDIPILTKLAKTGDFEMKKIYDYLTKNILVVNHKMRHIPTFFTNYQKDKEFKVRANNFIRKADFGISGLNITEHEIQEIMKTGDKKLRQELMNFIATRKYVEKDAKNNKIMIINPTTIHEIKNSLGEKINSFSLDLEEESQGTQELMAILYYIYRATKNGGVLCIDEFTSYLHPALVKLIINIFRNEDNKGQLIITTHDVYLLDSLKLRRDQIWITNKTIDSQETNIMRISREESRSEINMADRFMFGLYGSIPPTLINDF
ncbi:MAG: ATP-binding protein [candidate division SR1 bacterium]|nr:ATP-binding protein [candidate division SR1 bacterium]